LKCIRSRAPPQRFIIRRGFKGAENVITYYSALREKIRPSGVGQFSGWGLDYYYLWKEKNIQSGWGKKRMIGRVA